MTRLILHQHTKARYISRVTVSTPFCRTYHKLVPLAQSIHLLSPQPVDYIDVYVAQAAILELLMDPATIGVVVLLQFSILGYIYRLVRNIESRLHETDESAKSSVAEAITLFRDSMVQMTQEVRNGQTQLRAMITDIERESLRERGEIKERVVLISELRDRFDDIMHELKDLRQMNSHQHR